MICLICRHAEIIAGETSVTFQRGKLTFAVRHVPAQICPGCGEAYVSEEVAVRLLRQAELMAKEEFLEGAIEYSDVV
jgi:YgiT-type zinc finger domain-containing protein